MICHNCPGGDNPACWHPGHLWAGTNKDNTQDGITKGTIIPWIPRTEEQKINYFRGSQNNKAKLTEDQVILMREMFSEGTGTVELAKMFIVDRTNAWQIVTGRTWQWLLPRGSQITSSRRPRLLPLA